MNPGPIRCAAALCLLLALTASPAAARSSKPPVRALATVSSCTVDSAGVLVSVRAVRRAASRRSRRARRRARRTSLRGANLLLRFQLVPLFGFPRTHARVDLGKTTSGVREESFGGLPADAWTGLVRWRFTRGGKTLASGTARTERRRVAGRPGQAFCTLPVGVPPRDVTAPIVGIVPSGVGWQRGPLEARLIAFDDLSGVAAVIYRIDGGPIRTGRSFTLVHQGQHVIEFRARDVAGNLSPLQRVALRVDTASPSAPVLDRPFSVTADSTPAVRWTRAIDSGSGVQRYLVNVRDSAGRTAASFSVHSTGDAVQSAAVPGALPNGSYTVQVFALDGTEPAPFLRASATRTFRVDTSQPHVTATYPAGGSILPFARRNDNVTVGFDRPVTGVNSSTLKLVRSSGGQAFGLSCGSPCTSTTIDPTGSLEGLYTISASSSIKAEDGTSLKAFSTQFRVPAYEEHVDAGCPFTDGGSLNNPWTCTGGEVGTVSPQRCDTLDNDWTETSNAGPTYTANAGDAMSATFRRRVDLNFVSGDFARVEVLVNGSPTGPVKTYSADTGMAADQISFSSPGSGQQAVALRFTLHLEPEAGGSLTECDVSAGSGFYLDDLQVIRAP